MEIGCEQGADVKELMEQADYKDILVCEDFTGRDRVVSGRFGG